MVKVHNWNANGNPPDNPTANDMRYGIGCMNDKLMDLILKMSDLFPDVVSKVGAKDLKAITDDFKESTFGKQVAQMEKYYDDGHIIYTSLWNAVKDRNYFIHEFYTSGKKDFKKQGVRLKNLLNELETLQNQVDNAKKKVVSEAKKKSNQARNPSIRTINKAIKGCMDDDGYALLSDLGNVLKRDYGFDYKNSGIKLIDLLVNLGYEIYDSDSNDTDKYVRLHR